MKQSKKMRDRGFLGILTLMVLLGSLFGGNAVMTARAESESAFSILAETVPSDRDSYDIRLTIENFGADWEGTVRLIVDEDYRMNTAYDTVLSLPQGSKKQFDIKVPTYSLDNANGTVIVTLLDNKSREIARKEFDRLLTGEMSALNMGVLSDNYSSLTYLDMGGDKIYFYDDLYPVKLVELRQDNLSDLLDSLTFLVIDRYHTDILTDEEKEALEHWIVDGGVLIIGTGAYVEDTLSGFDVDSFGIQVGEVHVPGEIEDFTAVWYYEWSQLTLVDLQSMGGLQEDYYTAGWYGSTGDGSVCILPYSFTELASADKFFEGNIYEQEGFVKDILEEASNWANSRYNNSGYYDRSFYYIQRFLRMMGNSNSILNFGVLRAIVILYVFFVGPVLYLILRLMKRRELYWFAVPVTALLGIVLIFFAGRGFEVVSAKVYSVTVQNLSAGGKSKTYLHCYDAGHKEWSLRMAEGCDYVGPVANSTYYSGTDDGAYYYHIRKEGDIFSIGIKPTSNFEDTYFAARGMGEEETEGTLLPQDISYSYRGISGRVVNETNWDMAYFAVVCGDMLYIYENLPSGGTCSLEDVVPVFADSWSYYNYSSYNFTYDFLEDFYRDGEYDKASVLSALGVGLYEACPTEMNTGVIVVGVVENWADVMDDDCNEISYGCLYVIQ